MGSLWAADYQTKTDPLLDSGHTQPIHAQISTPSLSDEKAKGEDVYDFMQDTELVDFNEDASGTQAVCLAGETQVMDLGGETQLLDDFNCIADMETQLLDLDDRVVSDSADEEEEESDGTQVLDVVEGGDEEEEEEVSIRRGDGLLVDEETTNRSGVCEDSDEGLREQTCGFGNEWCNSGTVSLC